MNNVIYATDYTYFGTLADYDYHWYLVSGATFRPHHGLAGESRSTLAKGRNFTALCFGLV
jgi:hypothetical protein